MESMYNNDCRKVSRHVLAKNVARYTLSFQEGNTAAFESLYLEAYDYIHHGLLSRSNNIGNDVLQDIVQETFVKFLCKSMEIRNVETALSWLMRIALNIKNDYFRKVYRERFYSVNENREYHTDLIYEVRDQGAEKSLENVENSILVSEALTSLNDLQRCFVIDFYLEGKPVKDIAQQYGLEIGTVKTALCRARVKMKKRVA